MDESLMVDQQGIPDSSDGYVLVPRLRRRSSAEASVTNTFDVVLSTRPRGEGAAPAQFLSLAAVSFEDLLLYLELVETGRAHEDDHTDALQVTRVLRAAAPRDDPAFSSVLELLEDIGLLPTGQSRMEPRIIRDLLLAHMQRLWGRDLP